MSPETFLEPAGIIVGGCLLLAFAWLGGRLLRHRAAAIRHLVWLAAFVAVAFLPLAQLVGPGVPVAVATRTEASDVAAQGSANVPAIEATDTGIRAIDLSQIASQTPSPITPPVSIEAILCGLWLGGLALVLAQGAFAAVGLAILRRRSQPATFDLDLDRLARKAGVNRCWNLRVSVGPQPPAAMTWGIRRPIVLLPEEAHSWPRERLEAILLHELAHVRRRDSLSQIIAVLACALYWFNPVVWLSARAMRAESETAADDAVIRSGVSPSDYAEVLVRTAASLGRRRQPYAAIGVPIMKRSKIEKRVEGILNPRARRGATLTEALAVAATGLCLFLGMAVLRPAIAQVAPPAQTLEPQAARAVARPSAPRKAQAKHRKGRHSRATSPLPPMPRQGWKPTLAPAAPGTPVQTVAGSRFIPPPTSVTVGPARGVPVQGVTVAPPARLPGLGVPAQAAPGARVPATLARPGDAAPAVAQSLPGAPTPIPPQTVQVGDAVPARTVPAQRGLGGTLSVPGLVHGAITVPARALQPQGGLGGTLTVPTRVRGTAAAGAIQVDLPLRVLQSRLATPLTTVRGAQDAKGRLRLASPLTLRRGEVQAASPLLFNKAIYNIASPYYAVGPAYSKADLALLGSLRNELKPDSALAKSLKRLADLQARVKNMKDNRPDNVDLAKLRVDIATVELSIAKELQRPRSSH